MGCPRKWTLQLQPAVHILVVFDFDPHPGGKVFIVICVLPFLGWLQRETKRKTSGFGTGSPKKITLSRQAHGYVALALCAKTLYGTGVASAFPRLVPQRKRSFESQCHSLRGHFVIFVSGPVVLRPYRDTLQLGCLRKAHVTHV